MADQDRPYNIDVSFVHPLTQKEVKYKMRLSVWFLDMNLQKKCVTPQGEIDPPTLWIGRLLDTVEGLDDPTIRKLDQPTVSYLVDEWVRKNDATFLGQNQTIDTSKIFMT